VSVVEPDTDAEPLYRLRDAEGGEVTEQAHKECPGRAVKIRTGHGYVDPATGPAARVQRMWSRSPAELR